MKKLLLIYGLILSHHIYCDAQTKTQNIILITLDGLRWEEVFGGAADSLMNDKAYVQDTSELKSLFEASTPLERRKKLLPFFWETIAEDGQLYGNRWLGNKVDCSNEYWFSYPGYGEILTGFADPAINSNDKIPNPNTTVLEWLHQKKGFEGKVAAFGSWDVFPFIINEERSGIPVNAGYEPATGKKLSPKEKIINQIQEQTPRHWASVRFDVFTHHYAMEYVKKYHPRVLYVAYGETDDFAHDGAYDHYLKSARQTSSWIAEWWDYINKDKFYKGKTTMIITTDHGRGSSPKDTWRSHGKDIPGASAIWLAIVGPDTPASGEMDQPGQLWQNQIAKTCASLLGLDYQNSKKVGDVIKTALR